MPLMRCKEDDKPGWKYGKNGKCYIYTAGNKKSESTAKLKTIKQGFIISKSSGEKIKPRKVRYMKIPMIFCNRETVTLLLAFKSAFKHLRLGFKDLFMCIVLTVILVPLTLLDVISKIFRKGNK